jgi:hypothetical protein
MEVPMTAPDFTTIAPRFWSKVVKRDGPDGCWEWTGCRFPNGYGQLRVAGKSVGAHRLSWEMHHGPIPSGAQVLHRCDNKPCIRPDHLFLGSHTDNMADMVAKGRGRPGLTVRPERAPRGTRNGNAKLTESDVREIRQRYDMGETQRGIAAAFGVTQGLVGHIVRGLIWRHVAHDDS